MVLLTQLVRGLTAQRRRAIDHFVEHPHPVQQRVLRQLLRQAAGTEYGRQYDFASIDSSERYAERLPLVEYDALRGHIDRMRAGESDVLWPGVVQWFAKSSGTTSTKSKFIPVTGEGLRKCHMQGPLDVACMVAHTYPQTRVFGGKTLTLGGSRQLVSTHAAAVEGDLSAILIEHTPWFARNFRVPRPETALIPNFEQKVEAICRETVGQRVTAFAGVPSWNMVMLKKVLQYTGKRNVLEVWPDMELFTHGGMNFKPYRDAYRELFPSPQMKYMDTYNASEGFFAIQDDPVSDDMLLMLDYGVYYEFLPLSSQDDASTAVPLEGVRPGVNYAMVISSCNGLWRYQIGDTVEFTSTTPYKIRITGRTRLFINAFGEEVIIDNAERAMQAACEATGASVAEYTAAPIYMTAQSKGAHQWIVEFRTPPDSVEHFTDALDRALQQLNSDYEAKRFRDTTLSRPQLSVVAEGTFYRWMKQRGKEGGQNKVPRLSNDRSYVEQLLELR